MNIDREMLELAAKAAEIKVNARKQAERDEAGFGHAGLWTTTATNWNPLTDDGDALRLAVRLELEMYTGHVETGALGQYVGYPEKRSGRLRYVSEMHAPDPYAATRRAIVRAAAEIGKAMK